MKLEEIYQLWEEDSQINKMELGDEAIRIPKLHHKYFKIFSNERLLMRKLETEYKEMYKLRHSFYSGTIDEDTLREHDWEPNPLKILRADIPMHLESDPLLSTVSMKISMQNEKIELLESIIKSLTQRGYNINAAITWEKFKVGA